MRCRDAQSTKVLNGRIRQPARSSVSRTRAAIATAAGLSPWTQTLSIFTGMRLPPTVSIACSSTIRRTLLDDPPATPPAAEPEPPSPEAKARSAEHASAERMLRAALLIGLILNLAVFLGAGLAALPIGPLSRADALLGAVTLAAAVGMLALGELCRNDEPPSFRR